MWTIVIRVVGWDGVKGELSARMYRKRLGRTIRLANFNSSSNWSRAALNTASLRGGLYMLKNVAGRRSENA